MRLAATEMQSEPPPGLPPALASAPPPPRRDTPRSRSGVFAPPGDKREIRIALFLMNEGDYQELLREDCIRTARRHGFPVEASVANNDSARQLEQIQACLGQPEAQRPTAILVCPVREAALLPAAVAAARQGVGWVLLGRWSGYMADLREEFPRLPIFSVAADQREIGRIQGKQFRALLPQGGEVVYIRGPLATSSATLRFEGMQETLEDAAIKVFPLTSDWTLEGGARAVQDWLRICQRRELPKVVVAAQNDAMAIGARNALNEAARAASQPSLLQIPVTGSDGSPEFGRRLVTQGRLRATVIMPPTSGRALREIAAMPSDGRARPPSEIALAPTSFPELDVLEASVGTAASKQLRWR
jgi:ribose transport system substrate-binding protein